MTYTNVSSSSLTLGCPGDWADASFVSEHMSGGSGNDGMVPAESTTCSADPGLAVQVSAGGTYTLSATFHNVPWPGSAVAITWGDAGTSSYVAPFQSSTSPSPGPPAPGSIAQPNWAAYSWHPQAGYVTYAGALWKVPKVNCSNAPTATDGRHARAAVWVGLWGGPNANNGLQDEKSAWLPQVGTTSQCQIDKNFTPAYIAVAQMFHDGGCNVPGDNGCTPQTLSMNVNYNDSMDAEVEYGFTGTGIHAGEYKFNYFLYDITTGAQVTGSLYTATAVPMVDVAYQGGAAVEDYNSSGGLAQFTTPIVFSKVTVGNSSGALTNPKVYRWDMVVSGRQLAKVSSFSNNSFTVAWKSWD
jgi:hypothetical protein